MIVKSSQTLGVCSCILQVRHQPLPQLAGVERLCPAPGDGGERGAQHGVGVGVAQLPHTSGGGVHKHCTVAAVKEVTQHVTNLTSGRGLP